MKKANVFKMDFYLLGTSLRALYCYLNGTYLTKIEFNFGRNSLEHPLVASVASLTQLLVTLAVLNWALISKT